MSTNEIMNELIDVMKSTGMYIDLKIELDAKDTDIDMREYIKDSFQYISFVVEVEEKFEVSLPEQLVVFENLSSLRSFANVIKELF